MTAGRWRGHARSADAFGPGGTLLPCCGCLTLWPCLCRINIEARKSPKLSRAAQEMSRSPRLPMRKPSIGSPSLTRREFPFEDITQVVSGLRVGHTSLNFIDWENRSLSSFSLVSVQLIVSGRTSKIKVDSEPDTLSSPMIAGKESWRWMCPNPICGLLNWHTCRHTGTGTHLPLSSNLRSIAWWTPSWKWVVTCCS